MTVFFTPLTGGVKRATLEFASNDPDEGSLRVSIVGVGLEPMIAVEPAAHDFGEVTALAERDHDFQLTNVGQATLAGTAEIAGPQAGDFSLVAGGGAFSLRPGVSRAMTVRFRPTSTGARQGALRLTSNDLARPELEAPLAGLGVAAVDVPALSPWAGAVLAAALALAALVWLRRAQAVS